MSAALTYASYAVLFAALVALEAVRLRRGSLTLGRIALSVAARGPVRVLMFAGWAWLGWHLFARGSVSFLH